MLLSEAILKTYSDANRDLAQVQQICHTRNPSQASLVSPGSTLSGLPMGAGGAANLGEIERFVRSWKERHEKTVREMQRGYSHEHSLLVQDYKKLDRDYQEA